MKDKELRKLIGSRAKQRRLELNLTQPYVAEKMGVTACPYQRRRCFFKRFITADVKTIWSVFGFLPVRLQKLQGKCWSDGYCQNNRV